MSRIPVDFTGISPAEDFPVYPAGEYIFQVTKASQETATTSGNLKLLVNLKIHAGPDGSQEFVGRTLVISKSFVDKARPFLLRFLNACGISREMLAAGFDDAQLIGRVFIANVTVGEYQGRKNNSVDREKPYAGVAAGGNHVPMAGAAPQPSLLQPVPGAPGATQVAPPVAPPVAPAYPQPAPQPAAYAPAAVPPAPQAAPLPPAQAPQPAPYNPQAPGYGLPPQVPQPAPQAFQPPPQAPQVPQVPQMPPQAAYVPQVTQPPAAPPAPPAPPVPPKPIQGS